MFFDFIGKRFCVIVIRLEEENIMRFLKRKKLGYQPFTGNPNEQLEIKVKNGVVYSKFLKYKFKLPEGAQLERFNYNSVWIDNNYCEFKVSFGLNVSVFVEITKMSISTDWEKDILMKSDFRRLGKTIVSKSLNVPEESVQEEKFLNLDCLHFSGITDRVCPNGNRLYVEEYLYAAPYCNIAFMAMCPEDEIDKLDGIFNNFSHTW